MRRRVLLLALPLGLSASGACAKSCKDPTTGKFITCPAATAATATAATATKPLLTLLLKEVCLQSRRLPAKLRGDFATVGVKGPRRGI